jgi:asparagine synthase (glutamine-hydrolysing)
MTERLVVLSPLESAVGDAIGEEPSAPPLPAVPPGLMPLEALEDAVRPALQRPPCLVLFSGGRDSSLVLAVALRVARREGLPLPIPVTHVFPGYPETDETEWQELVLRHLEVTDRVAHAFHDEMNLLGPFVRESIRRHGLVAPAGCHLWVPTLEQAGGGSLMTGGDGDGLFTGGSFSRARAVLRRRARPALRTPLTLARGLSPRPVRRAVARTRDPRRAAWLRPEVRRELNALDAAEMATEPFFWDGYVSWWTRRRHVIGRRQAVDVLARTHDVQVVHPLLDPRFRAVVAARGGRLGLGSRAEAMKWVADGLLPDVILTRESKADFTRAYWSSDTREFIARWDGGGVPTDLVDPEALRREWQAEKPNAQTGLLLQAAWAASSGEKLAEPVNCRFE